MKENVNVQPVKIMATEINLRATSLRSRLTDVVAIKKCGTPEEFRIAVKQFDTAVDQFKQAVI